MLVKEKKVFFVSHSAECGANVAPGVPELTRREVEVLFWIAEGKTNHDIGVILGAKTGTISKHVEHILSKLNVENRTSAAVMALERFRPVAEKPKDPSATPWGMVAGVIAIQLGELFSRGCEIFHLLPFVA